MVTIAHTHNCELGEHDWHCEDQHCELAEECVCASCASSQAYQDHLAEIKYRAGYSYACGQFD